MSVRLGKFPVVQRTLFCRRCNFWRKLPHGASVSHYTPSECFVEGHSNVSSQSLIFEQGLYSNKCSESLHFDHFYVQSSCNLLSKITWRFVTFHNWNISSIQCKLGLRRSKTARKLYPLVLSSFQYYRAHTRSPWAETTPEFSDNTVYEVHCDTELLGFWTFPSSGILESRKHVSETGSVSVLR
jgi:hypothetical protein